MRTIPPPWTHQAEALELCKDATAFAMFMEQRTGKSRVCIEKAARHHRRGEIDGLLIVSFPSGVHANWLLDELPTWMPEDVKWSGVWWNASKAAQVGVKRRFEELISYKGLAILSINCEALVTDLCKASISRFIKSRKRGVMCVADESSFFANWNRRTRTMMSIAKHCKYRMICDGTPADEGVFDLYFPLRFLGADVAGFPTKQAFQFEYGTWEVGSDWVHREALKKGLEIAYGKGMGDLEAIHYAENYSKHVGKTWPQATGFQNLEKLHDRLAPYVYRKLRSDCFDIPDKVYGKIRFDLEPAVRKVYDRLRDEFVVDLARGQRTVRMALTRILRLQQVAAGYWPSETVAAICAECDGDGCAACGWVGAVEEEVPMERIDASNARLAALEASLLLNPGPAVVWSRFRQDVDDIITLGERLKRNPVRYDGKVSQEDKVVARRAFQDGHSNLIVGNEASLQRGIRLDRADNLYAYANHFSLRMRRQIEDRAESPDRKLGTGVHDLVASNTVDDTLIIPALREKKRIADIIMNDPPANFL